MRVRRKGDLVLDGALAGAVLVAMLCGWGCGGSGPRRHALSGRVTFAGKQLSAGVIFFDPDVKKKNDGPEGFAYIKEGRYDTRQNGRGAIGGPHLVRIQGFDGKPGRELPMGAPLFDEYVTPVDLPGEEATLDFDVPAAARRKQDVGLK